MSDERVDAIPLMDDPIVILTRRASPSLTWVEPSESLIDRRIVLLVPRRGEPTAAALTLIETIKAHLRV